MQDYFSNKVAINGASRGIGYAIADELASLGCNLALISTKRSTIDDVGKDFKTEAWGRSASNAS